MDSGIDPDMDPDMDPDIDPDIDSDMDPLIDSDIDPLTDPDIDPDIDSDQDSDKDPDPVIGIVAGLSDKVGVSSPAVTGIVAGLSDKLGVWISPVDVKGMLGSLVDSTSSKGSEMLTEAVALKVPVTGMTGSVAETAELAD